MSGVAWIDGDPVDGDRLPIRNRQNRLSAWFIDVGGAAGARVTPIDKFDSPAVTSIAATGDGGFIVLAQQWHKYSATDWLICYDASGIRKWSISSNSDGDAALFSPSDVSVDRAHGGTVAVLDTIKQQVQFFDKSGKPTHRINLKKTLGQEMNYPTDIKFERGGGLALLDFDGKPPMWRLTPEGKAREQFTPHFTDGQGFIVRYLRLSPDDRIWTSDGQRLLRVNNRGEVDLTLGERGKTDRPENTTAIAVGPGGDIYTAAASSAAVQVFDSSGKFIRAMKALPEDFGSNHDDRNIAIAGDGSVYLSGPNAPYLRFKPDGSRAGWESLNLDSIVEKWHFVPGTANRWVMGYRAIWLVAESGRQRVIWRQPDHNWLDNPQCMSVARDGSAAVIAEDDIESQKKSPPRLNIYAADGSPVRTIRLPDLPSPSQLVYDGKRAVVLAGGKLVMIDITRGSFTLLALPTARENAGAIKPVGTYHSILLGADGKELWFLYRNRERARVERYELPAASEGAGSK